MAEVPSPRVGYRAILRSVGEQPLFLEVLGQQLGAWLAEKDVPTQIDDLSDWSDDQRAVTIRRWRGDDSVRYVRARMKEIQPGALTWITDVLASSEGWVSLTVENSAGRFVAVPRLARYMLELIPLGLGPDRFQDCAEIVDSKDVRDLVASILHDDRRTATFVIGTDERLGEVGESLVVKASKWAREMTGLGRFVVLSADATRRFQEIAGTHAVQPWTLRTFLTNARFDDPIDARRHRWLSTLTLAERDDKWIARMLGDVARAQAWQASEPSEVRRARSSFERLVQAQLVAAAQATPAPSAELQTAPTVGQGSEQLLEEMQQMLHQVFGVRVTEPEALTEVLRVHEERKRSITDLAQRLEDQQLTIDALQESQAQAQWLLEEDELEAAQAQLDLESR